MYWIEYFLVLDSPFIEEDAGHIHSSLAGSSVAVHLRFLRWCGFCRLGAGTRATSLRRLHYFYRCFALAVTALYMLQEIVYSYQERNDMEKIARVMFLLLCHVTSIVKQIVFHVDSARVDVLVASLDDPLFAPADEARRALQQRTATIAARLVRAYSGTAVFTCLLWVVFPVSDFVRGETVLFPFWIPVDYNRSPTFWLVLLYSFYVTTLVGIANTTMDAFMATVLYQCKTQLKILRMNFESLTKRASDKAKELPGEQLEAVLLKLFVECLEHYKKIYWTVELLQDVFGTAILIQFGIGGWILCMAAYKLVSLSVLSVEFASMTLFITCILTELLLYCYYGNEVTVESDRVLQSIYATRWLGTPLRFQRSLLVVMERAQRPLRPVAGLIIPLSLETFVTILKSSYTFYAVLRQTK